MVDRALELLLDWGFAEHDLVVVQWSAFAGNWASRRTVWSLGFSFGPTVPDLLPCRRERRDAWTAWLGARDPREPRDEYHAIVYLEPSDAHNRAALGFDMFSEPTRRAAVPGSMRHGADGDRLARPARPDRRIGGLRCTGTSRRT